MRIIGLLGGVASGKSLVAEQFRRLGAGVLDADRVGHEVLRLPEVRQAIRNHFGDKVFNKEGEVDRSALARVVFAAPPDGPRQLAALEQITHPEIRRSLRGQIDQMAADGLAAAVLDAPVMLEAGWDEICDILVFVDSPVEIRRARAAARGWSEAEFAAREAAQANLDVKRRRAEFVIDNSAAKEYTESQTERLWHSLVG